MERFTLSQIGVTEHFPKFGVALAGALRTAHLELGYDLILKPTTQPDRDIEVGDFEPRFITTYSKDLKVHARQAFLWHREEPLTPIKDILEYCIDQPIYKGWFPTIFYDGNYDDQAHKDVFGTSCYGDGVEIMEQEGVATPRPEPRVTP